MARITSAGSSTGAIGSTKRFLLKRPRLAAGIASRQCSGSFSSNKFDRSASSHSTRTTHHNSNTTKPCTPSSSRAILSEEPSIPCQKQSIVSPRSHLRPRPSCFCSLPRPSLRSMAFNSTVYSTASSDLSTPRSSSPSFSVNSARSSSTSISKRISISGRRSLSQFNPMSSVNIAAIEAQMKMTSLDQLRGYSQDHYGEVQQYRNTEYVPKTSACGYQVLREPRWNKGMTPCHVHLSVTQISTDCQPRSFLHTRRASIQELDWIDPSLY